MKTIEKKLVVFCHSYGEPDYICVKLEGTKAQFDDGDFYGAAKKIVEERPGHDGEMVVCDEDDYLFGALFFKDYKWDNIDVDKVSDCVEVE